MSNESKREPIIKNNTEDFPGRNTIKVTRSIEGHIKRGIKIETNRLSNPPKTNR